MKKIKKEFCLSDKEQSVFINDSSYFGSDIKKFLVLEEDLIRQYTDGKINDGTLFIKRIKLIGRKLTDNYDRFQGRYKKTRIRKEYGTKIPIKDLPKDRTSLKDTGEEQ